MDNAMLRWIGGAWRNLWMRRGIMLVLLSTCIFLVAYWVVSVDRSKAVEHSSAPKLELPRCPLWLGKGAPGDLLTAVVPLWNTGDAPLHIEKLDATCGCSSLSLNEKVIAPGEKADLHVGARLRANATSQSFGIRIISDDPQSPTIYEVGAEVEEIVRIEPSEVNFGAISTGREALREIRVYRGDGKNWLPTEKLVVESIHGLSSAEVVEPAREAGPSTVKNVIVKVRPDLPSGSFADQLRFSPSYSDRTAETTVRGIIMPPILASPSVLCFVKEKSKTGFRERRFILRRSDGKPIGRVVNAEVPKGIRLREMPPKVEDEKSSTRVFSANVETEIKGMEENLTIALRIEGENSPVAIRIIVAK
jgi:hypothetical protein